MTLILMTPPIMIASKNWIFIWSLFEVNTFAFVSMMSKKKESEEMMKYFLVQSIASMLILLSLNMKMFMSSEMSLFMKLTPTLLLLSMALKSGAAPFYLWMPPIVRKISWANIFLLLSIQKLAPTFFILMNPMNMWVNMLIILSISMGTLAQMLSMNFKMLITYSSVSHLSWMLIAGGKALPPFFLYYLVYTLLLFLISNDSKTQNITMIMKDTSNSSISLNILSFSGMPPLMGFMPKWMLIMDLMKNFHTKFISLIMIFMSCLNVFIYIRIFYFKSLNKQKSKKKMSKKLSFFLTTLLNFFSPLAVFFLPL